MGNVRGTMRKLCGNWRWHRLRQRCAANGCGDAGREDLVAADEDPERGGVEILWRETTEPRWQVYGLRTRRERQSLGRIDGQSLFAVRRSGKKWRAVDCGSDGDRAASAANADGTKQ